MSYQGQQKDKMIIKKISIRQKYLNKFEKKNKQNTKTKKRGARPTPPLFFFKNFLFSFFFFKIKIKIMKGIFGLWGRGGY
jgi:hypothetical protein